jgi:hypothetical protein
VVLIDDQQSAGDLAAHGADESFADGMRSGRLRRAGKNPDAFRRELSVEGRCELACTIPDQELDWSRALAGVHQEGIGETVLPTGRRASQGTAGAHRP